MCSAMPSVTSGTQPLNEAHHHQRVDVRGPRTTLAAHGKQHHAEVKRHGAPDHVRHRAVNDLAYAERDKKSHQAGLHSTHRRAQTFVNRKQGGKYISIVKGPIADSKPNTSAVLKKFDFMGIRVGVVGGANTKYGCYWSRISRVARRTATSSSLNKRLLPSAIPSSEACILA